jgi:hypothetical protein
MGRARVLDDEAGREPDQRRIGRIGIADAGKRLTGCGWEVDRLDDV